MTEFRPFGDRVLLRRIVPEAQTSGGIYLPEVSKGKRPEGEVVAVGEDAATKISVGEIVVTEGWSGHEIVIDGQEFLVCKLEELLGRMSEVKAN